MPGVSDSMLEALRGDFVRSLVSVDSERAGDRLPDPLSVQLVGAHLDCRGQVSDSMAPQPAIVSSWAPRAISCSLDTPRASLPHE
ncbi:MAG: hypothetical protein JL55_23690 [Pseudomonas sp. BICA1-14]|nr:MAG: hypothetical protein JL55_23690 [[Pseudomonas] sp. BICA1-14]